ncbi:hypothetical protein E2C01_055288 [Portunus trituberculatus]|uniref:Uncharacterized protein n=1 Tax=Portunus trituberculatus TaxID=210409 RepID=A0A5B7GQT0_PORTR|nr:hypothetical protein [Portunus trituberculatus]
MGRATTRESVVCCMTYIKPHRIEGRPMRSSRGKRVAASDISGFTNGETSSQDVSFLHGNLTLSLCPLSTSYLPGTGGGFSAPLLPHTHYLLGLSRNIQGGNCGVG